METKVKRSIKLFKEVITPENVLAISEMIAICETKYLIGWVGQAMIEIHNNLLLDIFNKSDSSYVLTDSYDLVQEVALLLCQNFGKRLSDTHNINNKGKVITIQMQACKELTKLTNYKCRHMKTDISFEVIPESELPITETNEEDMNVEEYEIDIESIIQNLGLNEKYLAVLNCRLNGMSFPQIAQVIQRATGTAYDYLQTIQRRYMVVYG